MDKLKPLYLEPQDPPQHWSERQRRGHSCQEQDHTENLKSHPRALQRASADYCLLCEDGELCDRAHGPSKIASPLHRLYEHTRDLSLFLFNDALLVSNRSTSHTPFERTSKSTHQFIASVALHRLLIEDISDTKCMYSFPSRKLYYTKIINYYNRKVGKGLEL